ncbi:TPA_asm: LO7 [Tilapia adomavirus 2]|uniref:LO7 n=1 Tax=Tilapia adomavirus 2 TaxID=2597804 RepID=A0A5H3CIS7_9VIRU|nr:TPA_asm: LO7 [Tilapia adomavirus 2]
MFQMTTPDLEAQDDLLTRTITNNMYLQPIREDFCDHVQQRAAQGPAGTQLKNEFNSQESKEITVTCAVEQHEAIAVGSIRFLIKARIAHTAALQAWSTAGDEALALPDDAIGVYVPSAICSSQFIGVDTLFGMSSVSLRALMPLYRSNQGSHGMYFWANEYFNAPNKKGFPHKGHTDTVNRLDYHGGRHVASNSETELEIIEKLSHPLNHNTHTLITGSFSDFDTIKFLPPGCTPRFKLTFAPHAQRTLLLANPAMYLVFESVQVLYTVVSIPRIQVERPLTKYTVMDIHCESLPLTIQQQSIYVPVTRGDKELVPQVIIIFVAHAEAFHPVRMTRWGPELKGNAIKSYICTFTGVHIPYFHAHTPDGRVTFENPDELNTMRSAFMGMATRSYIAAPESQLSTAQVHLLEEEFDLNRKPVHKCILVVTDPNAQVYKDSCGGVTDGRLDMTIDFNPEQITPQDRLYIFRYMRFDVAFNSPSGPQGNELSPGHCKPSYTKFYTKE